MEAPEKEKQPETPNVEQTTAPGKANEAAADDSTSELRAPIWSVVSFEKREAGNLTYTEAEEIIKQLEAQKVSGLCVVPDEVAARLSDKN